MINSDFPISSFLLYLVLYWNEKLYLKAEKLLPILDNISKKWEIIWSLLKLLISPIHLKKYFVCPILLLIFLLLWIKSIWFYLPVLNRPLILCCHCWIIFLLTFRTFTDEWFYHWFFDCLLSWFHFNSIFLSFLFFIFHDKVDSCSSRYPNNYLFVVSIKFFYFLGSFQSKLSDFRSSKFLWFLYNKNPCFFQKLNRCLQ